MAITLSYLEVPECSIAIAAVEVVAALKGSPSPSLPDDAKACVSRLKMKADRKMISLALKAVERIKTDLELKELWDETIILNEWYEYVDGLEARLKR